MSIAGSPYRQIVVRASLRYEVAYTTPVSFSLATILSLDAAFIGFPFRLLLALSQALCSIQKRLALRWYWGSGYTLS
jgi:hypothetical protein